MINQSVANPASIEDVLFDYGFSFLYLFTYVVVFMISGVFTFISVRRADIETQASHILINWYLK